MSERFVVTGGSRLSGEVAVGGAKNSVLKLMAAALLAEGTTTITNCPDILDVPLMAEVLRGLGATVELDGDVSPSAISTKLAAQVDTPNFNGHPSTCDRKQFGGLPAMCAPQQVLVTMHKGLLDASDEWIDVGGVYAG